MLGGQTESAARRISITIRAVVRLYARNSPIQAIAAIMPEEALCLQLTLKTILLKIFKNQKLLTGAI
jgi:hypothetical protein